MIRHPIVYVAKKVYISKFFSRAQSSIPCLFFTKYLSFGITGVQEK
jgi:hypothetical protein